MRWIRRHFIGFIAILVLVYLFVPIAVVAVLSFNNPEGKYNTRWNEFSFDAIGLKLANHFSNLKSRKLGDIN